MWIRTKNRKALLNVNSVAITDNGLKIGTLKDGEFSILLGEYKTEKRALEEVDEIQETLSDICPADYCQLVVIYEMPQE